MSSVLSSTRYNFVDRHSVVDLVDGATAEVGADEEDGPARDPEAIVEQTQKSQRLENERQVGWWIRTVCS